jgi:hypothetical protein
MSFGLPSYFQSTNAGIMNSPLAGSTGQVYPDAARNPIKISGPGGLLDGLDNVNNPAADAALGSISATMSSVFGNQNGQNGAGNPSVNRALKDLKGSGLEGWAAGLVQSANQKKKVAKTGNASIDAAIAQLPASWGGDIEALAKKGLQAKAEKEAQKNNEGNKKQGGIGGIFDAIF